MPWWPNAWQENDPVITTEKHRLSTLLGVLRAGEGASSSHRASSTDHRDLSRRPCRGHRPLLPRRPYQRCRVHFAKRNLLVAVPKGGREMMSAASGRSLPKRQERRSRICWNDMRTTFAERGSSMHRCPVSWMSRMKRPLRSVPSRALSGVSRGPQTRWSAPARS